MFKFFSRRKAPPPEKLRYDFPEEVRRRILMVFKDHASESHGGLGTLLDGVGEILLKQYGGLHRSSFEAARRSDHPVIEHFLSCQEDYTLDFIGQWRQIIQGLYDIELDL